ncbi:MAG TPA: translocation/assembly module TamB domain-containing protein, partial [Polyangiales bacterium]
RGTLVLGSLGQELSNVRGRLALHDDTISLESIELRDFDGRMNVGGKLVFAGLRELATELEIKLREFPIRRESAQVSRLTGAMKLRATTQPGRTRAELRFGDLRVNLPNDLGQGIQSLDPHPDIAVQGQKLPEKDGDPHRFELRVLAENPPFRVLRNDLSAEVSADLSVGYPDLTLEGRVEIDRGNFELYGKRFELRESRLSFDASESLDPLVSINAVYQSGGDEIGVRVEGRLSAPRISFSHSNPAITDPGAIIAQLLGARASDPAVQNADATGAAAGILAGATAGLLTQSVRDEFGGAIPVLSLESNSQTLRSARIRAGVQLDQLIQRLGPLRRVITGAYVEGFVAPGASATSVNPAIAPQSRGGGLLELRFPKDLVGTFEYRPVQNYRLDLAWEP